MFYVEMVNYFCKNIIQILTNEDWRFIFAVSTGVTGWRGAASRREPGVAVE